MHDTRTSRAPDLASAYGKEPLPLWFVCVRTKHERQKSKAKLSHLNKSCEYSHMALHCVYDAKKKK